MRSSIDAQALAASLRRLRRQRDATVLEPSLQRVVDACAELFDVTGSGLMLTDDQGALRYVVATDGRSKLLEDAQLETGQGPCLDTFVRGEIVASDSLPTDERYPALVGRLRGHRIGAVLGVPVRLSGTVVGSLDIFCDGTHRWSAAERDALSRYGQVSEALLAAAVSAEQAGELAAQLNYALDYRAPIERGVGYLMARDGLDQADAFFRLRSAARNSRRRIGDVAADLLRTGRLPGEDG